MDYGPGAQYTAPPLNTTTKTGKRLYAISLRLQKVELHRQADLLLASGYLTPTVFSRNSPVLSYCLQRRAPFMFRAFERHQPVGIAAKVSCQGQGAIQGLLHPSAVVLRERAHGFEKTDGGLISDKGCSGIHLEQETVLNL